MSENRALIVTSVASMIDQFNMPNIMLLLSMGYKVDVAANFVSGNTCSDEKVEELKSRLGELGVTWHQIDFDRNALNIGAFKRAYKQLDEVVAGAGSSDSANVGRHMRYDLIYCQSPIGGVVGRLVAKKHGIRCIYTAHGFHFYKGAPLKNRLVFYPIEKYLSRYTDVLITINKEDYRLADRRFHAGRVEYIPGVGVDTEGIAGVSIDREKLRRELGIGPGDIMLLSVGELTERKNHMEVIEALKEVGKVVQTTTIAKTTTPDSVAAPNCLRNPVIHYFIAGLGPLKDAITEKISESGLSDHVHLLGFRKDVYELCKAADIFVFPSLQEGLPMALMEAMASGLPCIARKIRGNTDLIDDDKDGILYEDSEGLKEALNLMINDTSHREVLGNNATEKIKAFDIKKVDSQMKEIYGSF